MILRVAKSAAAFAVLGLAGSVPQVRTSGGSAVPCAVPLTWRLARVDEGFGLSVAAAAAVIQQAAGMWAARTRRPLFTYDPEGGLPIRLVYDERQERSNERSRAQAELDEVQARITAEGDALKRRSERHAEARRRHAERQRSLERRVQEHNDSVRAWNGRGGAPATVAERLSSVGVSLEEERTQLDVESRALDAERRAMEREVARLNLASERHARQAAALKGEFPSVTMEAGEYREAVRMEAGRVAAVGREIRIYRFGSADELRLIVAHELGHALGLGHSRVADAVMSAEHDTQRVGTAVTGLRAADLEMLRAICPELSAGP